MWKSVASFASRRSQWCCVAACALAVCFGHVASLGLARDTAIGHPLAAAMGLRAATRTTRHDSGFFVSKTVADASPVDISSLSGFVSQAEPMLASLATGSSESAGERNGDMDGREFPDVCANSECGGGADQCWTAAGGRTCRDASLCENGSCSGPPYAPPIMNNFRAELALPSGYALRNAWLVLDDATFESSERRLLDTFVASPGVRREKPRPDLERLVFDLGLFRPGLNRFRVRGEAVKDTAAVLAVETAMMQSSYDVPGALGHVAAGTFRLPLIHFPRTLAACRSALCKDRDGDGLSDLWENVAATQLRPLLMMDSADGLFEQRRDQVRVLTSVVPLARNGESYVLFANVVTFSRDYGYLGTWGHAGDTEASGMLFRVDANETLHWVASAAKGHPCKLCKPRFHWHQQEFAKDGTPLLFVEKNKHGLWQNGRTCRQEAGFSCRGDRKLRPEAFNVGDYGPGRTRGLVDSLDRLAPAGPFGALAGLFPGEAVWTPGQARVRGRFCGGQRACSPVDSANQPGAVIARLVRLFQSSTW